MAWKLLASATLAAALASSTACEAESLGMPPPGDETPVAVIVGGPGADTFGPTDPTATTGTADPTGAAGEDCDPLADPLEQCGPGFECNPIDFRCHEDTGTGAIDDPCTIVDRDLLIDDCSPELACGFVSAGTPRCVLPCQTIADDCPVGTLCMAQNNQFGFEGYCLPECDPSGEIACPSAGDVCEPRTAPSGLTTGACVPARSQGEGGGLLDEPCTVDEDCGLGFACTEAIFHTSLCQGFDRCCSATCDVNDPQCLGVDFVCSAFNDPASPGLGICRSPDF